MKKVCPLVILEAEGNFDVHLKDPTSIKREFMTIDRKHLKTNFICFTNEGKDLPKERRLACTGRKTVLFNGKRRI